MEITQDVNIGITRLFVDLQNCLRIWSPLLVDQHSYAMVFLLAAFQNTLKAFFQSKLIVRN